MDGLKWKILFKMDDLGFFPILGNLHKMFWTCSYQRKGNCRSGQVLTFNFTYHRSNILVRHGCASSFDSPTCQATRSALAAASLQSRENMRKPASFSSPSFKICKFCVQPVSVVLLMIYTFGILRFQDSSLSNISVDIALLFWALAFLLAVKSHGNLWYIIYHSYWPIYAVICSRRSPNLLDVCGCMWADLKIAMAMGQSSILKIGWLPQMNSEQNLRSGPWILSHSMPFQYQFLWSQILPNWLNRWTSRASFRDRPRQQAYPQLCLCTHLLDIWAQWCHVWMLQRWPKSTKPCLKHKNHLHDISW